MKIFFSKWWNNQRSWKLEILLDYINFQLGRDFDYPKYYYLNMFSSNKTESICLGNAWFVFAILPSMSYRRINDLSTRKNKACEVQSYKSA